MQNTPKTWDIRCDFSKKLGNSQQLSVQVTSNLTTLVENSKKSELSVKTANEFSKTNICQIHMWYSRGAKVKYLVYHTKNHCGNNLPK